VSDVKISAEPRTEFGKGAARRIRRAGKVPAVLYGRGEEPKHVALPTLEFAAAIRRHGISALFEVEITDGTKVLALPKAIQRDPIKDTIEHVDMLLVRRGEKVTVEVPVRLVGEPARDTVVVQESTLLSVSAEATRVPDALEVSIEGMAAGTQVTAGEISLPEGVELAVDPETVVAAISAATTAAPAEETEEEEEGEGEGS